MEGGQPGVRRPRTFMLGMMRRNRNTMSMFTSRAMSHSDSRPSVSGFLERHTGDGLAEARDAGNKKVRRWRVQTRRREQGGEGGEGAPSRVQDRAWTATPASPGQHWLSYPSSYTGHHSGSRRWNTQLRSQQ